MTLRGSSLYSYLFRSKFQAARVNYLLEQNLFITEAKGTKKSLVLSSESREEEFFKANYRFFMQQRSAFQNM
jgi:hypothetical protein